MNSVHVHFKLYTLYTHYTKDLYIKGAFILLNIEGKSMHINKQGKYEYLPCLFASIRLDKDWATRIRT